MAPSALVAESDPDVRAVVAALLTADGFEVTTTGEWARAAVLILDPAARPFSAAVIDTQLPGFSPLDTLGLVRAAGCRVPVLLVGADRTPDAGGAGADPLSAYLPKPFARDSLLRAVGNLLGEPCRPDFVILAERVG